MKRVANIIVEFLESKGIDACFLVTGGGAMHLNDAFGRSNRIETVCCHHEQACSMAAEGYFRASNRMAAVNVTTGPGGINALNGVYGAYTDSIPMFVVSGQVKKETMLANCDLPLRQLGDQEADIIKMVQPVTKYAVSLERPEDVLHELEKCYFMAVNGRPGPVWLDVPIDVQAALVDENAIEAQDPLHMNLLPEINSEELLGSERLQEAISLIKQKLMAAERPVVMAGTGVSTAGQSSQFLSFVERLGVPVVTAWNAHDLVPDDHPQYAGRPGSVGNRAGNFAVQKADFLLVLGCRLNIRQISYNFEAFADGACKIMVDIDWNEMVKPTLDINLPIHADLRDFFDAAISGFNGFSPRSEHQSYMQWCVDMNNQFPVVTETQKIETELNLYGALDALGNFLDDDDVVVCANGAACVCTFQALKIKQGVRLFTNSGSASMGYDLPAAIGAAKAGDHRVVCIAGDGSIMMNLQELQTIVTHQQNIKIMIINNGGYQSIRQSQDAHFAGFRIGSDEPSGVGIPDFMELARAFGLHAERVSRLDDFKSRIPEFLARKGPAVLEMMVDIAQAFEPKLSSRRLPDGTMVSPRLEDMSPFLDRDVLDGIMSLSSVESA